eukprot:m.77482 g.77482  ORF g.77482 m.77482 type:complete len:428 (+) comp14549_c0_seq2:295-1578(+)
MAAFGSVHAEFDCDTVKQRIKNALWGMFIADAMAMPVHWYYNRQAILDDFGDSGIEKYEDAPHPHPDAFFVGMSFKPDLSAAESHGRNVDILGASKKFYNSSWRPAEIELKAREGEHGNAAADLKERYHYHHGMKAGQNTLGTDLLRVLLASVNRSRRYSEKNFLDDFVVFLTEQVRPDPYTEIYIRRWFENYAQGKDPRDCAAHQRDIWSIGSMGGLIRPLALSLLLPENPALALGVSMQHQILTHRTEIGGQFLSILVPALNAIIHGADCKETFLSLCDSVLLPLGGRELFLKYSEAKGPGNIPKDEMWSLHMTQDSPFDIKALLEAGEQEVIRTILGTACYGEQGVPLMLFVALATECDFERAVVLNANAGGDSCHRGPLLGALLGAGTATIPQHLIDGLANKDQLAKEIEVFATLAVSGGFRL